MLSSGQHLTSGRLKDSWKIATQLLSRGSHNFLDKSAPHFQFHLLSMAACHKLDQEQNCPLGPFVFDFDFFWSL